MKVLIIEDNKEISALLSDFLIQNGYDASTAFDGNTAEKKLNEGDFDIALMDLMLPFISGEQLLKNFRACSQKPVIVISAKSMLETRLDVLRSGADDFIIKPFDLNEVLVRIETVLRRSGITTEKNTKLSFGGIVYNIAENTVTYNDTPLLLTSKELQLLRLFLEHPKKVYSKANLYEAVWNDVYYYEDNTINVHVSNLRKKLKKATGHDYIETVWGIGYRLKEEQE